MARSIWLQVLDEMGAKLFETASWTVPLTGSILVWGGHRRRVIGVPEHTFCPVGRRPLDVKVLTAPTAPVKREGPDPHEAARSLLTILYLYPGYKVDSRGPGGLLMSALATLHPQAHAMLQDMVEAGEVLKTFWPEDPDE